MQHSSHTVDHDQKWKRNQMIDRVSSCIWLHSHKTSHANARTCSSGRRTHPKKIAIQNRPKKDHKHKYKTPEHKWKKDGLDFPVVYQLSWKSSVHQGSRYHKMGNMRIPEIYKSKKKLEKPRKASEPNVGSRVGGKSGCKLGLGDRRKVECQVYDDHSPASCRKRRWLSYVRWCGMV